MFTKVTEADQAVHRAVRPYNDLQTDLSILWHATCLYNNETNEVACGTAPCRMIGVETRHTWDPGQEEEADFPRETAVYID